MLFFCFPLSGKLHPHYIQYTSKDGLPGNEIYDIAEDNKTGLLWLGTERGLVSYDGWKFTTYIPENGQNPDVTNLNIMPDGSVWCINFSNQVLRWHKGDFKVVEEFLPYQKSKNYFHLCSNDNGMLLLNCADATIVFDYKLEYIQKIDLGNYNIGPVSGVIINQNHIFIEVNLKREYRNHPDSIVAKTVLLPLDADHLQEGNIIRKVKKSNFNQPNDNRVIFLMKNNLNGTKGVMFNQNHQTPYKFFQLSGQQLSTYDEYDSFLNSFANHSILSINIDNNNEAWIGTDNGLYHIKSQTHWFKGFNVSKIVFNSDNSAWVSSTNGGIFYIPNIDLKKWDESQLGWNPGGFFKSKKAYGIYWLGTGNGDLLGFTDFNLPPKYIRKRIVPKENDQIEQITVGDRHFLYLYQVDIPFSNGQLQKAEEHFFAPLVKSKLINTVSFINKVYENVYIELLKKHSNKNTFPEFARMNLSEHWQRYYLGKPINSFEGFHQKCNSSNPIKRQCHYELIAPDSTSVQKNVFYWKEEKAIVVLFQKKTVLEKDGLYREIKTDNNERIIGFQGLSLSDKNMILTSKKNHFYKIDNQFNTSKVEYKNGNRTIKPYQIINHDKNSFWALSPTCIARVDLDGNILNYYDDSSGIPINNTQDINYHSGKLYISTTEGFFILDVSNKNNLNPKLDLRLSPPEVNGKLVDKGYININQNDDIRIGYHPVYFSPKTHYKLSYRLKETDEWKETDPENSSIEFSRLAPDDYRFQLQATTLNNQESEILTYEFSVLQPIYFRWWFILGFLLFSACIGLAIYSYNIRRIKEKNELQSKINELQLESLQSKMNPHFIFNALNSIQTLVFTQKKEQANETLGKFADLMRKYLNHSSSNTIPLSEEIEALRLYVELESIRFPDIDIHFQIDPDLDPDEVEVPPIIIQPFVENAFKHGLLHKEGDKRLEISFRQLKNGTLAILVKDNGVGREAAARLRKFKKHKSYASKAIEERLRIINSFRKYPITIEIMDLMEQGIATGTSVNIMILEDAQ